MSNKWCFVNGCCNTSRNSPNKKFVTVPRDYSRKKKWFEAAKRDMPTSKSKFYCCEDHFKFEEDVENYIKFKLMGGNIKMKQGVVPHIFISGTKKSRKRSVSVPEKSVPSKRQKDCLVDETMTGSITRTIKSCKFMSNKSITRNEILSAQTEKNPFTVSKERESKLYRSIGIQTKSSSRSKYVMCNIKH